jgi:hypothetical protein
METPEGRCVVVFALCKIAAGNEIHAHYCSFFSSERSIGLIRLNQHVVFKGEGGAESIGKILEIESERVRIQCLLQYKDLDRKQKRQAGKTRPGELFLTSIEDHQEWCDKVHVKRVVTVGRAGEEYYQGREVLPNGSIAEAS